MAGWQLHHGLKYKVGFYQFRLLYIVQNGILIDTAAWRRSKYICHASAATPPEVGVLFVFR